MKSILSIIVLAPVLCVCIWAAEYSIDYFTTKADGNNVDIEWKCSVEHNVQRYEIERSTDGNTFTTVSTMDAHGTTSVYRYVDMDILMKGDGQTQPRINANTTFYRLKIVGSDNSITYSSQSSVIHNVSSVRRTWGMIKEMFK